MTKKRMNKVLVMAMVLLGISTLLTAACAPRQSIDKPSAGATDDAVATVSLPQWTEDSNCTSSECHTAEADSATDKACVFSLHGELACITCHMNEEGKLATQHKDYATAKPSTKLKKTAVSNEACLSCHDRLELASATAASSVLTDANGTVVNPHGLPATAAHEESISCSNCHKMHKGNPAEEAAGKVCASCHHQAVYECGTCHD
ncbi:MAG: cytochrome c3 family protein [Coriobacteriaceae bacterium]|jgi:hypothetical protein|nr:cytochrome c3 family protein [Coriobacteriaceae bacterium]